MAPPYWALRHGRWWPIPDANTRFVEDSHVELDLRLAPGDLVHVANKPYVHGDDVLDEMEELKVCVAYEDASGKRYDYLPSSMKLQAEVTPVYETFEGWPTTTRGARSWADLPATAIKYVRRIEELIGIPVALLSTSPEREDTILVRDPFAD